MIEIWEPRWKDRTVLIAKYKVVTGINKIKFLKAKQLKGKIFELDGDYIRSCPSDTNRVLPCYAVPLDKFGD